jgi:hypothetical protein
VAEPEPAEQQGNDRTMSASTPQSRALTRGRLPFRSILMIGAGWTMFAMVVFFYSMLPLLLLPGLPFLFLGVVSLVSALTQEAEKSRR